MPDPYRSEDKQPEPISFREGLWNAARQVWKSWQLASREEAVQMSCSSIKADLAMEEAYADI